MNSLRELLNKRTHCPFCNEKLKVIIHCKRKDIKLPFWEGLKNQLKAISRLQFYDLEHYAYRREYNTLTRIDDNIWAPGLIELDMLTYDDFNSIQLSCCNYMSYISRGNNNSFNFTEYFDYSVNDEDDKCISIYKEHMLIEWDAFDKDYCISGDFLFKYDDPQLLKADMERMKTEQKNNDKILQ